MELRNPTHMAGTEPGIMLGRESFGVGMQKNQLSVQPMPNMQLTVSPDGTAIYKPITATSPTYPGNGGGDAPSSAPVVQQNMNLNMGEQSKRKRGRPRKYGPNGTMALSLNPVSPPVPLSGVSDNGGGASGGFPSATLPPSPKKARGRPPGSGRKHQMASLGSAGVGFTPHVIMVKAGEDVSSKIMSFSQHGPRAVCILSANGAISNVTLRQAATSGGSVTYEGRFEILSLSGSFLLSERGGQRSRTGGLSVSLAGPDGRVLGGGVAGLLTAASPVQVIVGSFLANGHKESKMMNFSDPSMGNMANTSVGAGSPPSRGTPSESSGGPGSPLNHSTGACNNNNSSQGMENMPWK